MTIALLVMTDGRMDCIADAIPSLHLLEGVDGPRLIHDDSCNIDYRTWLRWNFPEWELLSTPRRSGFGGAIRNAWDHLRRLDITHFFATEDDFVVQRPVDVAAMASVLTPRPYLQQLVLKRQAWNDDEKAAGGIIEQHPDDYQDATNGVEHWVEHRRFFSTNPYLARVDLLRQDWPRGHESEGRFTHQLIASPKARFGFWGRRDDPPLVEHIGHVRVGTGY